MGYDFNILKERISSSLLNLECVEEGEAVDLSFHMTDWLSDLEDLIKFYSTPEGYSDEEVERILLRFLAHVPEHLAAAKKILYGFGVSDTFGIGAVEPTEVDNDKE
ncbi:MAG: hypothetical protein NC238_06280 [Dehalobacter sp.]|nr:hypothetical protein [Dehalobacter sp.]